MAADYRPLIRQLEARATPLCIEAAKAIRELTRDAPKPGAFGRLTVYQDNRDPEIDGEPVRLRHNCAQILRALARHPGRRITAKALQEVIYGLDQLPGDINNVRVHIFYLRRALAARLGYDPIESMHTQGYLLLSAPRREALEGTYRTGTAVSASSVAQQDIRVPA